MKIAILGHSPLALETALRFHLHGAAFTWYVDQDDVSLFTSQDVASDGYISDLGLSVLKEIGAQYNPGSFSWSLWKEQYERPLMDYLKAHQEVKFDEVVSVTKRFLAPQEEIPGRSRFLDLFRVIHHVDPKDFIEEQRESNPETYQRLTEEFVNSLASTIEMYQDFDLVIDVRGDLSKASASVSGRALGESRVMDKVHYGLQALKESKTVEANAELRELAVIGSDSLSAEILLSLEGWLKDQRSRLFIVTTEEEPYSRFLTRAAPATRVKLEELFKYMEEEFDKEVDTFTTKLREWQELDDFIQAKKPKPAEPIPRLNFFSGHNVTAIDELIDRKRMFLTLEKPEFRDGKKHPENNFVELKTVGVDRILVAHAKRNDSIVQLDKVEPGFFQLLPTRPNVDGGWEKDLQKLEGIEDEIFKLFSPADSHQL
jgi:hypothetical protein